MAAHTEGRRAPAQAGPLQPDCIGRAPLMRPLRRVSARRCHDAGIPFCVSRAGPGSRSRPATGESRAEPRALVAALLAIPLLALAAAPVFSGGESDHATKPPAEAAEGDTPEPSVFRDWLESRPELEKVETACVMCAGFGGAVQCGLSCDATGLTIRKPDGAVSAFCGRCEKGEWK